MWDFNDVTEVKHVSDFRLQVTFDNGLSGEIDLADVLSFGPVFEPLQDPAFFRQVRIEGGTLAWPNGADLAPETVYAMVEATCKSVAAENR